MLRATISRGRALKPIYNISGSLGSQQQQLAGYHLTASGRQQQQQMTPQGGEGNGYKYVNAEDEDLSFKGITDRAAATVFFTELFRGNELIELQE